MSQSILIVPVIAPILIGAGLILSPFNRKKMNILLECLVCLNSILVWGIILSGAGRDTGAVLFKLGTELVVFFRLDGMGMIFAGVVAILWPLATLYSFEYMEHDNHTRTFFGLYTMTYGVTLGIALAGNLVTLYVFYEMLTLVTFPLVLHDRTREARRASRVYLYYSIGGAACAFIGLIFVMTSGAETTNFILGGTMSGGVRDMDVNILLAMYVLAFFGFGVKAAVFPVQKWLPQASVAPTPVTALLHAVAVVKSGAFAIIRLTYYSYGAGFLRGTWAQYVVTGFVMFTIIYGSTMAVREVHFKRRLAYSTISNLSYILLGACMMSPAGMIAALTHFVFHAFMKICSFFCAGAVMHETGYNYVYELDGLGRRMPFTFTCFTLSALALTGIPPFAGFISKWNIARAALGTGGFMGMLAIGILLYSALMTAIYMFTVVVRAFVGSADGTAAGIVEAGSVRSEEICANDHEEVATYSLRQAFAKHWKMMIPLAIFAVAFTLLGIYSVPLTEFLAKVAGGVL